MLSRGPENRKPRSSESVVIRFFTLSIVFSSLYCASLSNVELMGHTLEPKRNQVKVNQYPGQSVNTTEAANGNRTL